MSGPERDAVRQLASAAEWRLLGHLLSRPRPGWAEEAEALGREIQDPWLRRAVAGAGSATEGAYHALLGPGGAASAREAASAGFRDPGRILADLAARYAAFGFSPCSEEPADHLSVECDFVSYLHLKETYALARGEEEAAAVTREARLAFLADHLAAPARQLAARMPPAAPPYLALAAGALAVRTPEVDLPPETPDDPLEGGCPVACGPAGHAPPGPGRE